MEKEWKVSVSHRSKLNVSFKDPTAYVEYPTHLNGWDIFADSSDCSVSLDLFAVWVRAFKCECAGI